MQRLILLGLAISCLGAINTGNISRMLDAADLNTYQALTDIVIIEYAYKLKSNRSFDELKLYDSYYANAVEKLKEQSEDKHALAQQVNNDDSAKVRQEVRSLKQLQPKASPPIRAAIVIASGFGERLSPTDLKSGDKNEGIDLLAPIGTRVQSIFDGTVLVDKSNDDTYNISVTSGDKCKITYYNLEDIRVSDGESIKSGQTLGKATDKNEQDWTALHIEFKYNGQNTDPSLLF